MNINVKYKQKYVYKLSKMYFKRKKIHFLISSVNNELLSCNIQIKNISS